ncbi:MAG: T9SS type A sorting domain-containing protein, partial [Chitinophagales bacterium]
LWDITGDHGGTSNSAKGNPPCDTTKPVSATNPCGYMLVINSAYKTDTAFQYSVTNLCPNTYYEISAWIKNICYKCGCDSNGTGASTSGYIPSGTNDSSGVQPNLAFDINGVDYYTTGNLTYLGIAPATQTGSDSTNTWVKRGFTYLTGTSQTSLTLTIRNNAPGGGGNDWALDDISLATCLPNMNYSPSLNPTTCMLNPITIYDTVRSYFNNYTYYKWQRSTDGGSTWTDVTGALGPASTTWNGSAWQYVTAYTVPAANTTLADSANLYRVVVATTSSNLSNSSCLFTDGVSIINLNIINCGVVLKTNMLSFNGKLLNDHSNLSWATVNEDEDISFDVERSYNGVDFVSIGKVNRNNNYGLDANHYSFIDPEPLTGKAWYRVVIVNNKNEKKYSRIIQLSQDVAGFELTNVINPFTSQLYFDFTSTSDTKIDVSLIDIMEKTVKKKSYAVYAGVNSLALENTDVLPSGIYILRVQTEGTIIQRKVLKQNR